MDTAKRALLCVELLEQAYPDAICSLEYKKPYELLIATRLSAQCTDARVNIVTRVLFSKYPTLESLAEADVDDIARIIHSCGFYKIKSRDVVLMCQMLLKEYNGIVPDEIEELIKLPGVGRKTANLIVGDVYGKDSVVCDTHCIRITNLLGLTHGKDPFKVEMQLREILPLDRSGGFCHRLVLHGRAVCVANRPDCNGCILNTCCRYAQGE